jgi:polyhydroxybutyrate depolymerase
MTWRRLLLGLLLLIVVLGATLFWLIDGHGPGSTPAYDDLVVAQTLQHEGRERHWLEVVPRDLPPGRPLLLALHGSRSDAQGMRANTFKEFDRLALEQGFAVAYPAGVDKHWNECRKNLNATANHENVDDVGFLTRLVDTMQQRHQIDPARVFVTGFSNGGHMAYRLALEVPERIAAIAPVVANLPVDENSDCPAPVAGLPVLIMNGSEDPVNPHTGGVVKLLWDDSRGEVMSSMDTARFWAAAAGYDAETQPPTLSATDQLETALWHTPHLPPVKLIAVMGGGHTMPHPTYRLPRLLGDTSKAINGPEQIWQFFASLP